MTTEPITSAQTSEIIRLVAKISGQRVRRLDDQIVADTIGMRVPHIRKGLSKAMASQILDELHEQLDTVQVVKVSPAAFDAATSRIRSCSTAPLPSLLLEEIMTDLGIALEVSAS